MKGTVVTNASRRCWAALERYAGRYAHPAYGPATVTLVGGSLRWKWSGFASELSHHAGDTFRVATGPLAGRLVEFRNRSGTPDALRAVGTVFDRAE